jgi:3-phenylpropionate/cinnamic acid dioxygenase small subunit
MLSLQELNDEREISLVYFTYCDIIDAKDFDRLTEVFTADAAQDYGSSMGEAGIMRGTAPLIAGAHKHMGQGSNCGATHHNVGNFRIKLSGDTAKAKVHYYAVHRGARKLAGILYSMWGEYQDDLIRTPAGWRVCNRLYLPMLTEGEPCTYTPD